MLAFALDLNFPNVARIRSKAIKKRVLVVKSVLSLRKNW